MVTNAHVISGSTAVTITDATGLHRAAVVEVDGGDDFAVLRVDDAVAAPLVVADEPLVTGSPEYVLAAQVRPGNSGGPLLDADGRVIGVVNARSVADPGTGYAIASPQVAPVVAAAAGATGPAGTGSCAAPAEAG